MTEVLDATSQITLEELLQTVERRRDEFSAQKFVSLDMIDEFKKIGIYRAATPRRFGGDALPPASSCASSNASPRWTPRLDGWQASVLLVYLAALPLETQAELYKDGPDVVFAGGLFPVQNAEQRMADGRSPGSGNSPADAGALTLSASVSPAAKEPRASPSWPFCGRSKCRSSKTGTWSVCRAPEATNCGLTASSYPRTWTFIRGGEPTVDEPLYRYPAIAYAAQVLAAVNLGTGPRRAGLRDQGRERTDRYYRRPQTRRPRLLPDRHRQGRSGAACLPVRSSTRYPTRCTPRWNPGDPATDKQKALLRLASTHVAKVGAAAVQSAYTLCGTAAIYDANPMQRYIRDASVVTQHAFLGDGIYDGAGAVLMDIPPSIRHSSDLAATRRQRDHHTDSAAARTFLHRHQPELLRPPKEGIGAVWTAFSGMMSEMAAWTASMLSETWTTTPTWWVRPMAGPGPATSWPTWTPRRPSRRRATFSVPPWSASTRCGVTPRSKPASDAPSVIRDDVPVEA